MRTLAILKNTLLLLGLLVLPLHAAEDIDAVDGPNVRVMRHKDGSKTVFTRSPNQQVLTKRTYSAQGALSLITVYRMDAAGNPTGCTINDGQGNLLYVVSYGYRKSDGQLVKEEMWDRRVRRTHPDNPEQEIPVQVVRYVVDEQGRRSAPIVINTLPGKTFEQVYGTSNSALESDPFKGVPPKAPAKPGRSR